MVQRHDLVAHLLAVEGGQLTDQQLMDECFTLLFAGHETIASALSWTWYLLGQHPEIYQKMLQEVDEIMQGQTPTYADLSRLPYCLQVFKEAMRIYPPVHAIVRVVRETTSINDVHFRKGTIALISPYILHREASFADPEVFNPDRFAPEQEKKLPRYAYLPFGAGPRICIGMHFALQEGHLLVASLAQRVIFEAIPDQPMAVSAEVTLHPRIHIRIRRRN